MTSRAPSPGENSLSMKGPGADGVLGQGCPALHRLARHDDGRERIDDVEVKLGVGHGEVEAHRVLVEHGDGLHQGGPRGVLGLVPQELVGILHVLRHHLAAVHGRAIVESDALAQLEDPHGRILHLPVRHERLADHWGALHLREVPGRLPLRQGVPHQGQLGDGSPPWDRRPAPRRGSGARRRTAGREARRLAGTGVQLLDEGRRREGERRRVAGLVLREGPGSREGEQRRERHEREEGRLHLSAPSGGVRVAKGQAPLTVEGPMLRPGPRNGQGAAAPSSRRRRARRTRTGTRPPRPRRGAAGPGRCRTPSKAASQAS